MAIKATKESNDLSSPFMGTGGLEVHFITEQLHETYEGDPWFGRCVKNVLAEIDEEITFEKPAGQHSILDLVWHMVTWREFAIDRLQQKPQMQLQYFEQNDWRRLDHCDRTLWQQVLERLDKTQQELVTLLRKQRDTILDKPVADRPYNFRKLLYGIIQHDIYHLGQIAYIQKLQLV